jgi:hypothetical protein
VLLVAGTAAAQPPPPPRTLPPGLTAPGKSAPRPAQPKQDKAEPPPPLQESLVRFDATQAEVRFAAGRWQLWAGRQLLKDFGTLQKDAYAALRIVRELGLNHRGTVGSGPTGFEYWLVDGKAPQPGGFRRTVVDFDPKTLAVEQTAGCWCLRDRRQILFNFGPSRDDATQAHLVMRKYNFKQAAYVGAPTPTMVYFLDDPRRIVRTGGSDDPLAPPSIEAALKAATRQGVLVPGVGVIGERIPLDLRRAEIRREGSEVHLVASGLVLGKFGPNEREARDALRTLQDQRVTELIRLGPDGFHLFLSHGQPIRGTVLGHRGQAFTPASLVLRESGGSWQICDGVRPLLDFGDRADEAKQALQLIQFFKLDYLSQVGSPLRGGMRVLLKR